MKAVLWTLAKMPLDLRFAAFFVAIGRRHRVDPGFGSLGPFKEATGVTLTEFRRG